MKLLVYGDLQADEGSERLFNDPTVPLQRWRTEKFFQQVIPLAEKCDGTVDLGDLTDNRSAIPIVTLDRVLGGIAKIPKGVNYKLIGNHEQYLKSNDLHTGRLTARKFKTVSTVRIEEIEDGVLVFASFFQDYKKLGDILKEIFQNNKGKKIYFFGHFSLVGAKMRSGLCLEGLSSKILDPVTVGLLGHIHKHQEIRPGLFYCGSPFQQDFGESGDKKYVAILDTKKSSVEWVELTGFPRYRTVSLGVFVKKFNPKSEDRFRVLLKSPQEADKFYEHPFSSRAEPIYDYQETLQEEGEHLVHAEKQDFGSLLSRYLEVKPFSSIGATRDDIEAIAQEILHDPGQ